MQLTAFCKALPSEAEGRLFNQILRIIKIAAVILITPCLQVSARSEAQTVTLLMKNATLKSVFAEIRKQTSYDFFYENKLLKDATRVNIEVKNASLKEALDLCFATQPFTYIITGTTIILKRKEVLKINTDQVTATPLQSDTIPRVMITGKVQLQDSNRVVLENVNVINRNTAQGTTTDANGLFSLLVRRGDVLDFSYAGLKNIRIKVNSIENMITVNLERDIQEQEAVTVFNTGYQQLPKERATGSFEIVNNEELNRRVGPDILSRLEGVSTSIFFDKRKLSATTNSINANNIIIRGLSTMTEFPETVKQPLIIINNFPYDGDINNINPNDVESITILKDAAASSIWGARAGNGVIVITTKQGKFNQPTKLTLNTNINVVKKPDLFDYPKMSSSDFIDVETFLFNQGFYEGDLNNNYSWPALTPVIELLNKRRAGLISSEDSAAQIDVLRKLDVRNDYEKYIYRTSVNQQYSLNLSGGSQKIRYSISGGVDKNLANLIGNSSQRITLRSDNWITPIRNLDIGIGLAYTNSGIYNNAIGDIGNSNYDYKSGKRLYPYAKFGGEFGDALPLVHEYRIGFVDTAGGGNLLDWKYRPLDELKYSDNNTKSTDVILNFGTNYKFTSYLSGSFSYQYERSTGKSINYKNPQTYYTRNLINLFSQISGNGIVYLVPNGGILDEFHSEMTSKAGRTQLNFNKLWNGQQHQVAAILGGEIRERAGSFTARRLYGYNPENLSFSSVDYMNTYLQYGGLGLSQIPNGDYYTKTLDRFVSIYGNAAYTYDSRYTLSVSARKDASNLFGVDINNKWKPLWSFGTSWTISNESFYKLKTIEFLKLRVTYGYQGNINNALSPYTIINIASASGSIINQPRATISTPADPSLSWETIGQLNVGLDFSMFKNRVSGSLEFYNKNSNNLIFGAQVDPTTGLGNVSKNSASLNGKGIDISLSTVNFNRVFIWKSSLLFSYSTNKVTDYLRDESRTSIGGLPSSNGLSFLPKKGRTLYGIYSFPFAGLDPTTGDPLGYLGDKIGKDYHAFLNQLYDTAHLIYHGSAIPTFFGFLNNTFSYKKVSLIVAISYRFGYFFRRSAINYGALFNSGAVHPDYQKRWQKPGDENITNVPSMIYPAISQRDAFYANSSANVFKGDNIRLQYVQLSYDMDKLFFGKKSTQNVHLYLNINNLGILWRANKEKLDPDYDIQNLAFPPPRSIALGLKIDF